MNLHRQSESPRPCESEISRERVEEMLRDIAFVLHLTGRVRAEIEADQEAEEYALA